MGKYCFSYNDVEDEFVFISFVDRTMKPKHIMAWAIDFGTRWYELDELLKDYDSGEQIWADAFYWHKQAQLGILEVRVKGLVGNVAQEIFPDDPRFWDSEVTHVRLNPTAIERFVTMEKKHG